MLKIGITGKAIVKVTNENTALSMGSGELDVFATPAMVALMEKAASESIKEYLSDEESSVGTLINVKHISATPLNMKVFAETEIIEIDGKKLVFKVKAFDDTGLIGEGTHERFIITKKNFISKANSKLK